MKKLIMVLCLTMVLCFSASAAEVKLSDTWTYDFKVLTLTHKTTGQKFTCVSLKDLVDCFKLKKQDIYLNNVLTKYEYNNDTLISFKPNLKGIYVTPAYGETVFLQDGDMFCYSTDTDLYIPIDLFMKAIGRELIVGENEVTAYIKES